MLKDKAAIVTGSTSGIGLGIARALARAGCNIMLNGFGESAAIECDQARIKKDFGVRAAFSPADMTKPAEIAAMVEATAQEFGSVGFSSTRGAVGRRRLDGAIAQGGRS